MSHWFNYPHIVAYVLFLFGFSVTLYYIRSQSAGLLRFSPSNASSSLPVYYAYTNFASLPNTRIDEQLGFIPHFLAFTFNWDMLNQCLRSLYEPNVGWRNVILVDNSPGKQAVKRRDWLEKRYGHMIITVLPTSSFLSFSHLQNLFVSIAQQSKCHFYSWSHMDITLLPLQEDWKIFKENINISIDITSSAAFSHTIYNKFVESVRHVNSNKSNWGLIFYYYDLLAAVRTYAYISTGPFDVAIPQYKADCDYYARLRLKGYQLINKHIAHVFHMPNILERKFAEEMRTCKWERAKEILDIAVKNFSNSAERTRWRLNGMRVADREANSILTSAGFTYFERKWGTDKCSPEKEPNWNLDPVVT